MRISRTVLGEPGGAIPPGHSTRAGARKLTVSRVHEVSQGPRCISSFLTGGILVR